MSKKSPPKQAVNRMKKTLGQPAAGADATSADVEWARSILAGEDASPPGDALRPEVAYALVEVLKDRMDAERLANLARADHRLLGKAARTGLHFLRSKKVEVDAPAPEPPRQSGTGQQIQHDIPSLASVYDGRWERLVWAGQDAPSGVQVFQARVSSLHGLVDFKSGTSNRREYRAMTRKILKDLGGVLIDLDQATWYFRDAARVCEAGRRNLPGGYVRSSQVLGTPSGEDHPAFAITHPRESAAATEDGALLRLYDLPELQFWHPDLTFLQQTGLKIEELATSRIVLSPAQRDQQRDAIMDRAVEEYFTPERSSACRRLLLDTAHILWRKDATVDAAAVMRAADLFTLEPERQRADPFVRNLLLRHLSRLSERLELEQGQEEPEPTDEPSGLIIPGS